MAVYRKRFFVLVFCGVAEAATLIKFEEWEDKDVASLAKRLAAFPLSSSSMSHDRTGTPVVCRDASHVQCHEIQRQNCENEQIRTLLDRQREQILLDCQAEIRKHEFQADYDRRSIQKLNETIESQQEELHRISPAPCAERSCCSFSHGLW